MAEIWKLGADLHPQDNLLDPITFDDVILAIKCNCRELTAEAAKMEFKEILKGRLDDMEYLFEKNLDTMLKMASARRNG